MRDKIVGALATINNFYESKIRIIIVITISHKCVQTIEVQT